MPEGLDTPAPAAAPGRPYHAKRPHRKSRMGCRNCKTRKVKCDESRPVCHPCTLRGEKCVYLLAPPPARSSRSRTASPASSSSGSRPAPTPPSTQTPASDPDLALLGRHTPAVTHQPQFIPSGHSEADMRLLWFYTTATYASFSTGQLKERSVDVILRVNVVQQAFANPFLMNCLLGLTAMHVNYLGIPHMGISRALEAHYRTQGLESYRKAIEAADPTTYPALLATSLFLCGLSTHVFRGEDARPFSLLDWMMLWKGIGAIIDVTNLPHMFRTGIAALLFRPAVDMDASARALPNYLLFMITSVKPDDADYPLVPKYYKALKFLGSLYLELRNGFSHRLFLRTVTFLTYLPKVILAAARERRPRALVILAHYMVFVTFKARACWWMDGIAGFEIPNIARFLGPAWAPLLRVPLAALEVGGDNRAIARLLLDDPEWDEPTDMGVEPASPEGERELAIRALMEEDVAPEVQAYRERKMQLQLRNS
ncbi:hypothetical protein CHGG_10254 [Chaetomium globosum CBS 148.51]|uniref:Zn(2)-C6 fungal-type domain-containing protein n=1 Tax=Chaetomium globosum (strain ATCC 6205 / CBS 148.51 / DSM 1962 / NBRC 6347 / NRRL 1970) TaxID=306901 RepID=Q2GP50_CHAGB|nr:uncharacterized protein CHGG_10254 [Chaetomium globosum CBS 148.51]EAQ83850.1 hypothetical protein CHGG_10254 [Chaetomium globosum CBS 148.51]